MSTSLTIFVSGMIAANPFQGGATWAVLQYLLGLQQLGHDVYFLEPLDTWEPRDAPLAKSVNTAYFHQIMSRFGFTGRSALLNERTKETIGLPYNILYARAKDADLLINISGMLTDEGLLACFSKRVYLDLDPAFNQLWHTLEGVDRHFSAHTDFVTVGLAVGQTDDCLVPTCGYQWHTTYPPVLLAMWPAAVSCESKNQAWTTIAHWRSYGTIYHEGVVYGQKAHATRPFFPLPQLTSEKLSIALAIHPDEVTDLEAMVAYGWPLVDPLQVAATPASYQTFIQKSKAEWGIAKLGYVVSRSGWFSDRSVCYLASGRPVLAQETGFSHFLPTGEGILSFSTMAEVLAGMDEIASRYQTHTRWAREIAETYFDSDKVLNRFLDTVGGSNAG